MSINSSGREQAVRIKNRANVVLAAAVAAFFAGQSLHAATLTWDADGVTPVSGGSGNWDLVGSLWTPDLGSSYVAWTNNAAPDSAVFDVTGPNAVTVNGNIDT